MSSVVNLSILILDMAWVVLRLWPLAFRADERKRFQQEKCLDFCCFCIVCGSGPALHQGSSIRCEHALAKTSAQDSQTPQAKQGIRSVAGNGEALAHMHICVSAKKTHVKNYTHTQTLLQIIHIDVYVFRNAACMYLGIPMAYMFSQITVCTYHRQKWQYTESKYIEILNPVFWAWAITIFSESKQRSSRWSRPMKWRSVRNRVAGWEVKPSHPNWY